jgi:hypothetical protein
MNKILIVTLILALSASAGAHAGTLGEITNKGESSFKLDASSRNPFWPIGWKPSAKFSGKGGGGQIGDIPASAFVVSSITIDSTGRFAIINGKTMKQGQQFGLKLGAQTYQVTIKRVEDGRVILSQQDQELPVPLRRK